MSGSRLYLENPAAAELEWVKRFKEGRDSLDDDARPERPVSVCDEETVARVEAIIYRERKRERERERERERTTVLEQIQVFCQIQASGEVRLTIEERQAWIKRKRYKGQS